MLVRRHAVMMHQMAGQGVLVLGAVGAKAAADEVLRRGVSVVTGLVSAEVGPEVAAEVALVAGELFRDLRLGLGFS